MAAFAPTNFSINNQQKVKVFFYKSFVEEKLYRGAE